MTDILTSFKQKILIKTLLEIKPTIKKDFKNALEYKFLSDEFYDYLEKQKVKFIEDFSNNEEIIKDMKKKGFFKEYVKDKNNVLSEIYKHEMSVKIFNYERQR